jgi:hypothetical protein
VEFGSLALVRPALTVVLLGRGGRLRRVRASGSRRYAHAGRLVWVQNRTAASCWRAVVSATNAELYRHARRRAARFPVTEIARIIAGGDSPDERRDHRRCDRHPDRRSQLPGSSSEDCNPADAAAFRSGLCGAIGAWIDSRSSWAARSFIVRRRPMD